jgi:hypothetical protein
MAKSSRQVVVGLALVGVIALIWVLRPDQTPVPAPPAKSSTAPAAAVSSAAVPSAAPVSPAATSPVVPPPRASSFSTMDQYRASRAAMVVTPAPLEPEPAERSAKSEVAMVRMKVRDYRATFGSNPVGSNAEITRALMGANPRGAKYLDPARVTLSAEGELLDRWGRPYFFHAMSGTMMEVRSAGPDGVLFNADDVISQ